MSGRLANIILRGWAYLAYPLVDEAHWLGARGNASCRPQQHRNLLVLPWPLLSVPEDSHVQRSEPSEHCVLPAGSCHPEKLLLLNSAIKQRTAISWPIPLHPYLPPTHLCQLVRVDDASPSPVCRRLPSPAPPPMMMAHRSVPRLPCHRP